MARDISSALHGLSEEIDRLQTAYLRKVEEVATLKSRILDMEADLASKDTEIGRLGQENQFLRVSYRLADSPDGIIEARKKIAGLMRSIDKCISQLKE